VGVREGQAAFRPQNTQSTLNGHEPHFAYRSVPPWADKHYHKVSCIALWYLEPKRLAAPLALHTSQAKAIVLQHPFWDMPNSQTDGASANPTHSCAVQPPSAEIAPGLTQQHTL